MCAAFYNPICAGSDFISVYLINYATMLFKIWREQWQEKLKQISMESVDNDDDQNLDTEEARR